jgi:hypothetical protein
MIKLTKSRLIWPALITCHLVQADHMARMAARNNQVTKITEDKEKIDEYYKQLQSNQLDPFLAKAFEQNAPPVPIDADMFRKLGLTIGGMGIPSDFLMPRAKNEPTDNKTLNYDIEKLTQTYYKENEKIKSQKQSETVSNFRR